MCVAGALLFFSVRARLSLSAFWGKGGKGREQGLLIETGLGLNPSFDPHRGTLG